MNVGIRLVLNKHECRLEDSRANDTIIGRAIREPEGGCVLAGKVSSAAYDDTSQSRAFRASADEKLWYRRLASTCQRTVETALQDYQEELAGTVSSKVNESESVRDAMKEKARWVQG